MLIALSTLLTVRLGNQRAEKLFIMYFSARSFSISSYLNHYSARGASILNP